MQLKKTLLASAALLSAGIWAPSAQALPVFARQTGMACNACHFQHFPVLNSFGRSFKAAGYTMVGSEEKVEAEHLSIPAVLNAAVFINAQYIKTNGTVKGSAGTKNTNNGQVQIPNALSLFLGGRVAENIGFLSEVGLVAPAGVAAFKMPIVGEFGDIKVSGVPFTTDALGVAHSYELFNTGAVAVHGYNQADLPAISAQQYINTATPASGVAFTATNDMGFVNIAKWTPSHAAGGANGGPTSNYLRIAATPSSLVEGWDMGFGLQVWSGTSNAPVSAAPAIAAGTYNTKASAIDFQAMGEVAGMPLLIAASYANAPASDLVNAATTGITGNLFNLGPVKRDSFNIGFDLGVLPGKGTVQLALRQAKSGTNVLDAAGVAIAGSNATDNAILIGGTYELAMNVKLGLTYSKYSGTLYNANNPIMAATGNSQTILQLEAAF